MKCINYIVILIISLCSNNLIGQAQFEEVALAVGIDHRVENNGVGGGVSFVDFDDDGDDDITLATEFGIPLAFYENNDGIFTRLDPLVNNISNIKQIIWLDYDNDGDKDLYVNAFPGVNKLYENKGVAGFDDVTAEAELSIDTDRSYGAIWADFNRDGWLDLFTQERRTQSSNSPNINRLYFNDADRSFTEVTLTSGTADEGRIPFCAGSVDYNNDNWPDIYIVNDRRARNTLFRNNTDGTFTDVSLETGSGIEMDGMSVTMGDYDRDGDQDIYVTNIEEGNVLLRNDGVVAEGEEVTFTNVAEEAGVRFNSIGWGANWIDNDNDGDLDLYVSGSQSGERLLSAAYYRNNDNGEFSRRLLSGMEGDTVISYNNAIGDFNQDGLEDIIVFNNPPFKAQLWENKSTNTGNWIKLRLQGVLSNKDAVGSKIEIYADGSYQQRVVYCGEGFIAQNSFIENIGIGTSIMADSIVVTWPTGHVDRFLNVAALEQHLLVEGASTGGAIDVDDDIELVITSNKRNPILDDFLVKLHPNPVQSNFNIKTDLDIQVIRIFNTMGQQLMQLHGRTSIVDVSDLPAGIYLVNLSGDAGTLTKKIIIGR